MSSPGGELAGVTEIQRFTYKPGDRFIVRYAGKFLGRAEANDVARYVIKALDLPPEAPLVVTDSSIEIEIVGSE